MWLTLPLVVCSRVYYGACGRSPSMHAVVLYTHVHTLFFITLHSSTVPPPPRQHAPPTQNAASQRAAGCVLHVVSWLLTLLHATSCGALRVTNVCGGWKGGATVSQTRCTGKDQVQLNPFAYIHARQTHNVSSTPSTPACNTANSEPLSSPPSQGASVILASTRYAQHQPLNSPRRLLFQPQWR